jgi:hypothetical protein
MTGPAVDWSQFRDGDRVRVTFEGTLDRGRDGLDDERWLNVGRGRSFRLGPLGGVSTALTQATSADLIERPFTPPAPGKLFRHADGRLFQALSENRFMVIRWADGVPAHSTSGLPLNGTYYTWAESDPAWRDAIEVLDI